MADKFGCSKSTVLKYLKIHGITTRKSSKPTAKTNGALRYGEKIQNRKIIRHKRELETLNKMLEMRERGLNNEQIATALNAMKIPTKQKGGKWHRRTIWEFFDRHDKEKAQGQAKESPPAKKI